MRNLMAKSFGITPQVRKDIYQSIAESQLCYACPVWFPKIQKFNLKKIISVQKSMAVNVICGFSKTCGETARVLANILPIEITLKLRCAQFKLKRTGRYGDLRFDGYNLNWYQSTAQQLDERKRQLDKLKSKLKESYVRKAREALKDHKCYRLVTCLISDDKLYTCKQVLKLVDFYTTQHLTGRGAFGYMMKKMKKSENEQCVYCNENTDTAAHRLFFCPGLQNERSQLLEPMLIRGFCDFGNLLINEGSMANFKCFCKLSITGERLNRANHYL